MHKALQQCSKSFENQYTTIFNLIMGSHFQILMMFWLMVQPPVSFNILIVWEGLDQKLQKNDQIGEKVKMTNRQEMFFFRFK